MYLVSFCAVMVDHVKLQLKRIGFKNQMTISHRITANTSVNLPEFSNSVIYDITTASVANIKKSIEDVRCAL